MWFRCIFLIFLYQHNALIVHQEIIHSLQLFKFITTELDMLSYFKICLLSHSCIFCFVFCTLNQVLQGFIYLLVFTKKLTVYISFPLLCFLSFFTSAFIFTNHILYFHCVFFKINHPLIIPFYFGAFCFPSFKTGLYLKFSICNSH